MFATLFSSKKLPMRIFYVFLGSFLMALSMNLFIATGGLLPGGFVGLSILIQRIFAQYLDIQIPYTAINLTLNILPAAYAFFRIGRRFVYLSFFSVAVSSFLIDLLPVYTVTNDMVLTTVFAGFLNGIGLIIILNANASAGGTDFIAIAVSNLHNVATWNYVMVFNGLLLVASGLLFGLDKALYSIIYQYISTQLVTSGHLRYQRKTAFIITKATDDITNDIMALTGHGITLFKGQGAFSGEERHLLYMVVGRKDVRAIKNYLRDNAPDAFMNVTDSEQLRGRFKLDPMD